LGSFKNTTSFSVSQVALSFSLHKDVETVSLSNLNAFCSKSILHFWNCIYFVG